MALGFVGGAIAAMNEVMQGFILDTSTGFIYLLNGKRIKSILKDHPKLYASYNMTAKNLSIKRLLIKKLNERALNEESAAVQQEKQDH